MNIKTGYAPKDILNIFRAGDRFTRITLFNAENQGQIPKASRVKKGHLQTRNWSSEQLPQIGQRFGFLKRPKEQHIVCFHTGKGGVLKSTMAFSFARTLALNGIKVVIVGLDIQISITNYALPKKEIGSLEEYSPAKPTGLAEILSKRAKLEDVVQKTDLPTLDIIPETTSLGLLERQLRTEKRQEYFFQDNLLPLLKGYEVVIFDNSPNWNALVENSLTASNHFVSPIACELGCFEALVPNMETVADFARAMKLEWDSITMIPTLREKNRLSEQIYGAYISQYPDRVLTSSIRRAIAGQEALMERLTVFEADPLSDLANDYYDVISSLWSRVLATEGIYV